MRTVPAFFHLATGPSFGRAFDLIAQRVSAIVVAWRGRRAVAELAHFDARMLSDIGLSRSDVVGAIEQPMNEDPTAHLAAVVRERRKAEAAQKREAVQSWN